MAKIMCTKNTANLLLSFSLSVPRISPSGFRGSIDVIISRRRTPGPYRIMAAPKASGNGETRLSTLHVLLIVCLGLVGQTIMISHFSSSSVVLFGPTGGQNLAHDGAPSPRDSESYPGNNPLAIPPGQAVNLPSVRDIDKGIDRKAYGGEGDG